MFRIASYFDGANIAYRSLISVLVLFKLFFLKKYMLFLLVRWDVNDWFTKASVAPDIDNPVKNW